MTFAGTAAGMRKQCIAMLWVTAAGCALLFAGYALRDGMQVFFAPPAATSYAAGVAQSGSLTGLAAHLQKHPGDARAWAIFARLKTSRGEYGGAAAAYAHAVDTPGKVARDPLVWCEYADALAMANGGRLAGKPRELIWRALVLDSKHPRALEMAGSAEIEAGDYAAGLYYWEKLLVILPPDAPERAELMAAVERTRMRAGR